MERTPHATTCTSHAMPASRLRRPAARPRTRRVQVSSHARQSPHIHMHDGGRDNTIPWLETADPRQGPEHGFGSHHRLNAASEPGWGSLLHRRPLPLLVSDTYYTKPTRFPPPAFSMQRTGLGTVLRAKPDPQLATAYSESSRGRRHRGSAVRWPHSLEVQRCPSSWNMSSTQQRRTPTCTDAHNRSAPGLALRVLVHHIYARSCTYACHSSPRPKEAAALTMTSICSLPLSPADTKSMP